MPLRGVEKGKEEASKLAMEKQFKLEKLLCRFLFLFVAIELAQSRKGVEGRRLYSLARYSFSPLCLPALNI